MAEQDPLEYTSKRFEQIKKEALDAIRGTGDLEEGWEKAQKAAEDYYSQMKQQKALASQLGKEYEKIFKTAERKTDAFVKPFEKVTGLLQKWPIDKFFNSDKIDSALSSFRQDVMNTFEQSGGGIGGSVVSGITEGFSQSKDLLGAVGNLGGKMVKAFTASKALLFGGAGLVIGVGVKLWGAFKEVDDAASQLAKTTGILDDRLSSTLIRATESSSILGGNVGMVAETAKELVDQFSVAVPLSSVLLGNVAMLSEKFGLGNEVATKLTRIIAQRVPGSLEEASALAGRFIDNLGRIGPAVVRNITENYEEVNNKFGLGIDQLQTQGLLATQLGISLGEAANVAEGLLNIGSSITSEFKASALLGEQLNLQRARQLAFEGDIVGANQEILDQVSQIGDLSRLNTFQRQALAEATGKTVSELERELEIRRQIGTLGRIQQRTRETALGRVEQLTRAISAQFFRVFGSPEVQQTFTRLLESFTNFITGDTINNLIRGLSSLIDKLGMLARGDAEINPWGLFGLGDFVQGGNRRVTRVNDAIITNRGELISTNPKDYLIATQTPGDLVSSGVDSETKQIMNEVRGLLKHLKDNGVKAGDTYLDGRKVNKTLAGAMR